MTLTRKTPLKRTGFKRKEPKPFALADRATTLKRSEMKRRIKKPTVAEGSKYLAACRNEVCYLRIPGTCPRRDPEETSVPAHRNEGKGIGLKVSNELTCPSCFWCHVEYDQGKRFTREEKREIWNRGYAKWEPRRARKMNIDLSKDSIAYV